MNGSRNPLKSGQCFLLFYNYPYIKQLFQLRRNPLKSGQCFLPKCPFLEYLNKDIRRNPLKSGQCFLQVKGDPENLEVSLRPVAIPSNRVNVSYFTEVKVINGPKGVVSRNPLKSGQCFLLGEKERRGKWD